MTTDLSLPGRRTAAWSKFTQQACIHFPPPSNKIHKFLHNVKHFAVSRKAKNGQFCCTNLSQQSLILQGCYYLLPN